MAIRCRQIFLKFDIYLLVNDCHIRIHTSCSPLTALPQMGLASSTMRFSSRSLFIHHYACLNHGKVVSEWQDIDAKHPKTCPTAPRVLRNLESAVLQLAIKYLGPCRYYGRAMCYVNQLIYVMRLAHSLKLLTTERLCEFGCSHPYDTDTLILMPSRNIALI